SQRFEENVAPSFDEDHEEQQDRVRGEQVVDNVPDRVEPAWKTRQERLQRALEVTRWVRDDQQPEYEQGRREHEEIRRSTNPWLSRRRAEDTTDSQRRRSTTPSRAVRPRRKVVNVRRHVRASTPMIATYARSARPAGAVTAVPSRRASAPRARAG